MIRGTRTAALAALWLVPVFIFVLALGGDWVATWRTLGVPSMTPQFLDLYNIPTGIETMRSGKDPMAANPADPLHRPTNYPRVWLYLFSAARITRANVSIVALIFCALYLSCISYLIAQSRHGIDAVILLVAGLCPAPLLAMERGNTDLLVFSAVFLGCVVSNRYLKSGLFAFAGLLKIYPVVALMMDGVRRPVKERVLPGLLTALVLILILLQWHDLTLIRQGTPVSRTMSYGALSLESEILHQTFRLGITIGAGWILVLGCWLAGALAVAKAWENPRELRVSISNSKSVEMFCAFGGIYAFTYAVGSSWDYRLIFLIPTIPFVLDLIRAPRHRSWAMGYLGLVGIAESSIGFEASGGTEAGHAATFGLFLLVLAMLTNLSKDFLLRKDVVAPARPPARVQFDVP